MSTTETVVRMPRKSQTIERITLTPDMAAELLEHNTLNRPLSDQHVQRISRQIAAGKWQFNGDTIKVADTGDVVDGQHRLWAIIEAKKSVETIIVRGIERSAFATVDTISKPRSGSDLLALCGVELNKKSAATALQWLVRWQRKCIAEYRAPTNRVENSDIEQAFAAHPGIVSAVDRVRHLKGIASRGVLAFFYYILTNRNPDLAERMVNTLENPAGVGVNDPFFRLRGYFIADSWSRKDPVVSIALAIKAANAAFSGKHVQMLSWKNQGSKAEAFPELIVK